MWSSVNHCEASCSAGLIFLYSVLSSLLYQIRAKSGWMGLLRLCSMASVLELEKLKLSSLT